MANNNWDYNKGHIVYSVHMQNCVIGSDFVLGTNQSSRRKGSPTTTKLLQSRLRLKSGHELQMELHIKTDWQSVVTWFSLRSYIINPEDGSILLLRNFDIRLKGQN
jgi:hypothetical protein